MQTGWKSIAKNNVPLLWISFNGLLIFTQSVKNCISLTNPNNPVVILRFAILTPNEIYHNETKRNETKWNVTKFTETKRNGTKQNEMYTKTGRECNLAKRIYWNGTKQNMSKHTCLFQARSGWPLVIYMVVLVGGVVGGSFCRCSCDCRWTLLDFFFFSISIQKDVNNHAEGLLQKGAMCMYLI